MSTLASWLSCLFLRVGIESYLSPKTWVCLASNKKINKTQFSARRRTYLLQMVSCRKLCDKHLRFNTTIFGHPELLSAGKCECPRRILALFGGTSTPDISFVSDTLIIGMDWSTMTALSSDHLPIHITLQTTFHHTKTPKIKFINYAKASIITVSGKYWVGELSKVIIDNSTAQLKSTEVPHTSVNQFNAEQCGKTKEKNRKCKLKNFNVPKIEQN
ncbi:hypothetical protein HELRODRAFT_165020 [Helobdella robusta]|uniref:Endonuclease/exonuclease/phosphatase domain-containing protein n=1 Tax=Helobdella robusta TaxID=6412 RepID=T1EW54_HELRO|nr:hypothetical protein HELRODRAFT_165020 [Helobdella robusta]ESN92889.1 hypothetical protein HELRODRAFT_165020 [Helobdella robusta]